MEINEEKTVDMLSTESVSIDEPISIPYPEEKNC